MARRDHGRGSPHTLNLSCNSLSPRSSSRSSLCDGVRMVFRDKGWEIQRASSCSLASLSRSRSLCRFSSCNGVKPTFRRKRQNLTHLEHFAFQSIPLSLLMLKFPSPLFPLQWSQWSSVGRGEDRNIPPAFPWHPSLWPLVRVLFASVPSMMESGARRMGRNETTVYPELLFAFPSFPVLLLTLEFLLPLLILHRVGTSVPWKW